jgi:hypothetical protein
MSNSTDIVAEVQQAKSLAGQTATVVYKNGKEKSVTFGPDVTLQWIGGHIVRTNPPGYREINGYLTDREFPQVEDAELIIGNDVFRFSSYGRGFFNAVEPVTSRTKLDYHAI